MLLRDVTKDVNIAIHEKTVNVINSSTVGAAGLLLFSNILIWMINSKRGEGKS
jgi:hypothetical protein